MAPAGCQAGKRRVSTLPATSTTTPPAPTAPSRCRSWSRRRPTRADTPWGLDWFVQAGHGGNGNRNCTLAEDASLATPAYPSLTGPTPFNGRGQLQGPAHHAGHNSIGRRPAEGRRERQRGAGNQNMWRWQSLQEYPVPADRVPQRAYKNQPLFLGMESVDPGHEHTSMSVIDGPDAGCALRQRDAADRPGLQRRWVTRRRSRSGRTASIAMTRTRAAAAPPSAAAKAATGTAPCPAALNEAGSELERHRAEAASRGRRRHRHHAATTRPSKRMKWMAQQYSRNGSYYVPGAPRARRAVQPGRQQRLQHRAPP